MNSSSEATQQAERQEKWDRRFLSLADLVATWSKDTSTKVGAVITTPKKVVVSIGYNGFAQNMPDCEENYRDRKEKYSRIVHAETNAILLARADVGGCTMYATFPPCDRCAVSIIQAGIIRVVCPSLATLSEDAAERWYQSMETARRYFGESGVTFVGLEGVTGKLTIPMQSPGIRETAQSKT